MNREQWQAFQAFRTDFKERCSAWLAAYATELAPLQQAAAQKDTPPYPLETAVVYNRALDDISAESRIKYIVIGDNPGKDEQRAANRRYLVGQSGKIAQGFFARNAELDTDFRTNVIILNKTPVHTAKTAHLRYLAQKGGPRIQALIAESTRYMAEATARLHRALYDAADGSKNAPAPQLWLVGYTELKGRGLFLGYRDALKAAYGAAGSCLPWAPCPAWQAVGVYRHFSMNQFLIELKKEQASGGESLPALLSRIGARHKQEIFG